MNTPVNFERLLLRVKCLRECPRILRSSQLHCQVPICVQKQVEV